ncbi:MAG: SGNH/GDSL hydrolase family protein [Pseudomonadota bacterium]
MMSWRTLIRYYKGLAIFILNTVLFFILINLGLGLAFLLKDRLVPPYEDRILNPSLLEKYHLKIEDYYPGLTPEDIGRLWKERWSIPYVYEPFTQFRERPFKGKYLNVDANGFRITRDQGPWPPTKNDYNIFLFGGSTTFNYGVRDEKTMASYLQGLLSERVGLKKVRVYNFGRGHYFLTQERVLFERLLSSGAQPDMAIFIDGLNDFRYPEDKPLFTERFDKFVRNPLNESLKEVLKRLPLGRAILAVQQIVGNKDTTHFNDSERNMEKGGEKESHNEQVIISRVIARYVRNKRMVESIGQSFGVRTVFVWQPVPTYNYHLKEHPFSEGGFAHHTRSKYGYPQMATFIEKNPMGNNFIWCADIQRDIKGPLYIDPVHYSERMSEIIAKEIYRVLMERDLL